MSFDPDAACTSDDGWFGLPHTRESARVRVISVPWEVTTSFRRGTAKAPARVLRASHQVDLYDPELGECWKHGIAGDTPITGLSERHAAACRAALPVIEAGGVGDDEALLARASEVEVAGDWLNAAVLDHTARAFEDGCIPAILGGDHSVPYGAMVEAIRRFPGLGILHIDAHADLRTSYEGFRWSHASILGNVLDAGLAGPLVQVGVRDLGYGEAERIDQDERIHSFPWRALASELCWGRSWDALVAPIVDALPHDVWITFDVDGLDPSLCPNTGTPVPGGLSWDQTLHLLGLIRASGRRVVGFDLVEVGDGEWDAIVGARLLYQLAGTALFNREEG